MGTTARRTLCAVTLLGFVLSLLTSAAPRAGATLDGNAGAVLYSVNGDIQALFVGDHYVTIASRPENGWNWEPSGSADGTKIVFLSDYDAQGNTTPQEIYVMNSDGSGRVPLGPGSHPVFAPDGSIFYQRSDDNGMLHIWHMGADGSYPGMVGFAPDGPIGVCSSSDGQTAPAGRCVATAYTSPDVSSNRWMTYEMDYINGDGNVEHRIMVADTLGQGTHQVGNGYDPTISPDGAWIAWTSDGNDHHIMKAANALADTPVAINTDFHGVAVPMRFSADGTQLAFLNNDNDVWVMGTDGADPHAIQGHAMLAYDQFIGWLAAKAPVTSLTVAPSEGSHIADPQPSVRFASSTTQATFECSIDGADYSACTSPLRLGPLSVGDHTFTVRARWNHIVDPTPVVRHFSVIDAPPLHATGRLLLSRELPDGYQDIFSMNPDGTDVKRLTNDDDVAFNDYPSSSPDGTKILYVHQTSAGVQQIYLMNADGTNQHALTAGTRDDSAVFSPDGTTVYYRRGYALHSINVNGTNDVTIMTANSLAPLSITPDGTKLVSAGGVYLMNVDGTSLVQVATGQLPRISPDGLSLIYYSGYGDRISDLDGSNTTTLPAHLWSPDFAPGGTKIVGVSQRQGGDDIVVMDPDGSNQVTINSSPNQYYTLDMSWSTIPITTPDTTPPTTTIKSVKKNSRKRTATVTFLSSEANSTFTCTLDTGIAKPCTSPARFAHLKKGRHALTVVATDSAGNTDPVGATANFKL